MSDLEQQDDIPMKENCVLMIAVIQAQDCDIATEVLEYAQFSVTRLPSVGGFLGRRNATLLIGVPHEEQEKAKELLNKTCRKRVSFIAVPIENAPLPMPMPTPVTIGGVNLFTVEIEHCEEI